MNIITRSQAKQQGQPKYYTGVPCKNGHVSQRRTDNGSCVECAAIERKSAYTKRRNAHIAYMKRYYADNKPALNAYTREYYQLHKEHLRRYSRERYQRLVEYYREYNREYYDTHREYFERRNRQYYIDNYNYYVKYWADNSDKYNHQTAKRRAALKQAVPPWADFDEIHKLYQESKLLTEETGVPHEVDHVVPLQNELVCGLHWEGNLQIITQIDNRKKSNKHKC